MPTLYETVKRFFDATDWAYDELGDDMLMTSFGGGRGEWHCVAQTSDDTHQFVFYSIFPEGVRDRRRDHVMEFLTRVNYGLAVGNFEIDLDDGEVRFKTSIDIEGSALTLELWRHIVYLNVTTMDTYFHGIAAVADGECSAREMVAAIEADEFSPEGIDKLDN